jgi:hypothetical protein
MASERQRQANRSNGRKGGPKTEAGKQRSRLNTLKHGLTSTTLVVLPEEHEHEYEEVLRGFRDSFQPHGAAEDALVLRLAQAHWRSLRSRRVETGILNITAANERALARNIVEDCPEHLSPHNGIAVGFMINPAERWQMYLRYDTTISREFFRTLEALTRLQKGRQRNTTPEPVRVAAAGASPIHATPELSDSGIRSVSQNSPADVSGLARQPEKPIANPGATEWRPTPPPKPVALAPRPRGVPHPQTSPLQRDVGALAA